MTGPNVDIHKPKAAHSLRELATELGTITIGILIALALEGMVVAYRVHDQVEFSRADFRAELEENQAKLAADIEASNKLRATLEQVMAYGTALLAKQDAPEPKADFSRSFVRLRSGAWSSALSSQVLEHFPHAEERAIAEAYSQQEAFQHVEQAAEDNWFALAGYDLDVKADDEIKPALRQLAVCYAYLVSQVETEKRLQATELETLRVLGK
jgi:hypothetical protein